VRRPARTFDVEAHIAEQERRDPGFRRRVELEVAAMDFARQLIVLRAARRLSQAQFGRRLDVSRFVVNEDGDRRTTP
jgi:hypothetical protein